MSYLFRFLIFSSFVTNVVSLWFILPKKSVIEKVTCRLQNGISESRHHANSQRRWLKHLMQYSIRNKNLHKELTIHYRLTQQIFASLKKQMYQCGSQCWRCHKCQELMSCHASRNTWYKSCNQPIKLVTLYPTITIKVNTTVLKEVNDIRPARWGNGDTLIHFDV